MLQIALVYLKFKGKDAQGLQNLCYSLNEL